MGSSKELEHPLSPGFGYGIILGLGAAFALGMIGTTWALKRYHREIQTSEAFSTAGRTVKSGLVASAVVSSWTCATVQVLLFATIAIELKRRAPNAHTFLEAVKARYGPIVHGVYILFGLMTNVLVTAMLLSGGSAVASDLTGIPTAAACFLLPIGVVLYTMFGGIKATFLTDYVHTVIILVILLVFAFTTYATSDILGSPGAVWELLQQAAERHPVDGNAGGSYLTMQSREGAIFFVINIVGNFGTVFLDNGYYNKAIAASPVHALPGYVMGGLSWFAIPWLCATTMGLAAVALEKNPAFPTYPHPLSNAQVSAGLVLPNAAVALLGKGGAGATLLLVFMAVTSAMSAELIAVSSIFTYDIYNTYISPNASGKKLITMSHISCVVYSVVMAGFATGLFYGQIGLGYIYLMMGVIISSAVIPATLTLMWKGQNAYAAGWTPILGLACSLSAWLGTAKGTCGSLDVDCTGSNYPMLAGNVAALLSPLIFIPILTLVFGSQNYDWESMKDIRRSDDSEFAKSNHMDVEQLPGERRQSVADIEAEQAQLKRSALIARTMTVFLTLALLVIWPWPMYGTGYIFSKNFFTGWVVIAIMWLFGSAMCVGVYPVFEGRKTFAHTCKSMVLDAMGKWHPPRIEAVSETHSSEEDITEESVKPKVG